MKTVDILSELIAFPTISPDSNLEMIHWLANYLEGVGARVDVLHDPSGKKANLFATLGPDTDGGILLSGHTDVVPVADQTWSSDPFAMVEKDDKLFGRGTCDMKGFIASCLAAAPLYASAVTHRPLHFAFTHDEETGCIGAQSLVADLQARGLTPGIAIIGEPTSMQIIEGHKGCFEYTTHFTGLEGHGSAPDKGVNAAEYATRYVSRLLELRHQLKARAPKEGKFDPPETTINIGGIHGGVAHNVIVGKAHVDWEMRPVQSGDAEFVKDDLAAFSEDHLLPAMQAVAPDASIRVEVMGEVVGLEPMADNAARDLVATLTGVNGASNVAFGTEAGLFQSMGMAAVVCGPGSIEQAHKPDEFITRAQLGACDKMLEKLAGKL